MESKLGLFHIIVGAMTILSSLCVVTLSNSVVAAMCLMATLFFSGGLFFALGAPFVAAAQILIYAGAISVLFVFVVMLLDLKPLSVMIPGRRAVIAIAGIVTVLFSAAIFCKLTATNFGAAGTDAKFIEATHIQSVSQLFVSKYMIPFQVTGFLILAAVLGVVVLAKPKSQVEK